MICNRIYGRYGRLRGISMQDKITINPFDPDSIDEAIKKLEKRKERIHKCAEKLIQRLTDLGVEKAQELVPVDTGTARSSIIGYLELLSSGPAISLDMQKKYIDIAYVKAKRLEKLIEDLFGFTKMNYGKISMNVGKVDIVKLLGQLLEEFYPSFADKDLTYELKSNVPSQVITADGNLLARLFDNLINNAIKYGAEGKKVLVQVLAKDDTVTLYCSIVFTPDKSSMSDGRASCRERVSSPV